MEVCAEPVLPADGGGVWEPVDLHSGAQRAEGDGGAFVAHNHMVPHWTRTTGEILMWKVEIFVLLTKKVSPGKVPR